MEPKSKDTQLNRRNLSWLQEQSVDLKISLLQNHLSICQIMINEMLEEEVTQKAGARYTRDKPFDGRYSRWGFNPGSVRIGDQKVKIDVPRLYDNIQDKNAMLERYEDLKLLPEPTQQLINGVLLGLSMRDYAKVIDHMYILVENHTIFQLKTIPLIDAYLHPFFTNGGRLKNDKYEYKTKNYSSLLPGW